MQADTKKRLADTMEMNRVEGNMDEDQIDVAQGVRAVGAEGVKESSPLSRRAKRKLSKEEKRVAKKEKKENSDSSDREKIGPNDNSDTGGSLTESEGEQNATTNHQTNAAPQVVESNPFWDQEQGRNASQFPVRPVIPLNFKLRLTQVHEPNSGAAYPPMSSDDVLRALRREDSLPTATENEALPGRKVIIHCVRHAQAVHNTSMKGDRWLVVDPPLTMLGINQSLKLAETFEPMNNITHILVSPLKRTLHTTQLAFHPLISKGLKVIAYPDLREIGESRASFGTDLEKLFGDAGWLGQGVDTSLVPKGWEHDMEPSRADPNPRKLRVRQGLWELGQAALQNGVWNGIDVSCRDPNANVEILVVTHADFLKRIVGPRNKPKEAFHNTEYRSYEFVEEAPNDRYRLYRTEESKRRKQLLLKDIEANACAATHPSLPVAALTPMTPWMPAEMEIEKKFKFIPKAKETGEEKEVQDTTLSSSTSEEGQKVELTTVEINEDRSEQGSTPFANCKDMVLWRSPEMYI